MKYGVLLVTILLVSVAYGQWTPSISHIDTVRYKDRIGGNLDSLDAYFPTLNTFPSNFQLNSFYSPSMLYYDHGGFRGLDGRKKSSLKFTGLPHIGFAYSFGTKGYQSTRMQYQQVFSKKILVNLDYLNDRANGFLRDQASKMNDINLNIISKGKIYTFHLTAFDRSMNSSLNGGLASNADLENFALIFQPVNKQDAEEKIRHTSVALNNYVDLLKDSTPAFGLSTLHDISIKSRKYTEIDTLFGLYPVINIDSAVTSDKYQLSTTTHGAGIFLKNTNWFFELGLNANYWKYFNLGREYDTLETNARSNIYFKASKIRFGQSGFYNLIGAGNEWNSSQYFIFQSKDWLVKSDLSLGSRWPDQFQRFYYSNNYDLKLSEFKRQFRVLFENEVAYLGSFLPVYLKHSSSVLQNNLFWSGEKWTDTLFSNVNIHQMSISTRLTIGALSIDPKYTFSSVNGLSGYIPSHMVNGRISVKGGLFKAKKLKAYAGIDVSWQSSFVPISFIPVIGAFDFNLTGSETNAFVNLHAFGGLAIDEFRFFVRYENIGYFWNERTTMVMNGFPLSSGQLKFGITWDFFN